MEDAVTALQRTIAALEAQRALIGAAAVDAALRPGMIGRMNMPIAISSKHA